MYGDGPALIIGAFLWLTVLSILRYLRQKQRASSNGSRINPLTFIVVSLGTCGLGGVFTGLLGVSSAPFSFALALGIILSFSHPVAALSFFLGNLLLRPWEVLPEHPLLIALPKVLAFLCIISWALYRVRERSTKIIWNRGVTFFFLLVIWLLVSATVHIELTKALTNHFNTFFPIIVLCLLLLNTIVTELDIKVLRASMLWGITGVIASAVYVTELRGIGASTERLVGIGLWGNANDLAALTLLILPLLFFWRGEKRVSFSALFRGAILFLLLAALWKTQSRTAIIALSLMTSAYFIFCSRFSTRSIVLFVLLAFIPVALFKVLGREAEEMEASSTARHNYMIAGLRMVRAEPIFGVGMGNYPELYDQYTPAFTEYGKRTAHSSWILVMAESGFIGLFLFVGLFLTAFKAAWRERRDYPEYFLALVGYGTAMSFLSHTYLFIPYVLFFTIIIAYRVHRLTSAVATPRQED